MLDGIGLRWLRADWELLDPWFLLFAAVAWVAFAWRVRRPRAALPTGSAALFEGLPRTLRARCASWLTPLVWALAVSVLSLAMARPVTRDVIPTRSEGVDIMLVVDVSSSMDMPDMGEDASTRSDRRRIEVARDCALEFARARESDRVGLMTFARYADLRCPPTLDREALAAFLRVVDTVDQRSEENATAIGLAVAQCAEHFDQSVDAANRIVVLLTDGEETAGVVLPVEGAKLAADEGVRVHTIGIGQVFLDAFGRRVDPDFSAIEEVAETTGGRFFRARNAADLAEVYDEIDRMEKRAIEDPRFRTSDWFVGPLLLGVALFALGLLLEVAWIRGLP